MLAVAHAESARRYYCFDHHRSLLCVFKQLQVIRTHLDSSLAVLGFGAQRVVTLLVRHTFLSRGRIRTNTDLCHTCTGRIRHFCDTCTQGAPCVKARTFSNCDKIGDFCHICKTQTIRDSPYNNAHFASRHGPQWHTALLGL